MLCLFCIPAIYEIECLYYFTICLVFDFKHASCWNAPRQVLAPTWDQLAEKLQGASVPATKWEGWPPLDMTFDCWIVPHQNN